MSPPHPGTEPESICKTKSIKCQQLLLVIAQETTVHFLVCSPVPPSYRSVSENKRHPKLFMLGNA
eukprot:scaffold237823_cov17-Cyclotella_meneghiniana.AAC.1